VFFKQRDVKTALDERIGCGDASDTATDDSDSFKHEISPCAQIEVSALAIQVRAPSVQDLRDSQPQELLLSQACSFGVLTCAVQQLFRVSKK
jgi:hypothetical protein